VLDNAGYIYQLLAWGLANTNGFKHVLVGLFAKDDVLEGFKTAMNAVISQNCKQTVNVVTRAAQRPSAATNFSKYMAKQPKESPIGLITQWDIPKYNVADTKGHGGISERRLKSMQKAWYRKVFNSTMLLFVLRMAETIADLASKLKESIPGTVPPATVDEDDDYEDGKVPNPLMQEIQKLATAQNIGESSSTLPKSLLLKKICTLVIAE
jgi:hypothetical protein